MSNRCAIGVAAVAAVAAVTLTGPCAAAGQTPAGTAGAAVEDWTPPRTAWGHPDLEGIYTNSDENGTPLERPADLEGLRIDDVDSEIIRQRQERAQERAPLIGGTETGAGPPHWYEHLDAQNSQLWFVVDPPDGRIPPQTAEAQERAAARAEARRGRGPHDSWLDHSLYDRCITRGVPGSMMPAIYGNAYEIVQTPDAVVIRYEMIHEARVIPLDDRPRLSSDIRQYMGDARGRWEGDTLVVETTNFRENAYRNSNPDTLRLVERFTPVAPDRLQWSVTIDDPRTWERPWTFTMPLKKDASQPIFEYACHEGNLGLANILRGARAEEAAAAAAEQR